MTTLDPFAEPPKRPPSRRLFPQGAREMALYRCTVYPTRVASQRCDHCGRLFCDEAMHDTAWGHVCTVCRGQLERRAELRRTSLRRSLWSVNWIPFGIVMALSLAMAAQLYVVSNGSDLRRDLAVKMQLLFDGSDPTRGALVSAAAVGGRATAAGGSQAGHEADALIDGLVHPDFPAWRSADTAFPLDLVLKLNLRSPVASVTIRNHPSEPPASYPRRLQVLTSYDADPRIDAAELALARDVDLDAQPETRIEFPISIARYVVLRVSSNHGHAAYVSIGEIDVRTSAQADR